MLAEFDGLEASNPRGFLRVTQLIGHLMRNQFVHAEDRGAAQLLETLHRPELARLVEAYFDVAGYRLVHRATEGWAGILPDPERTMLPRLRIDETIALLVMRRLWEQALSVGDIHGNGTVRTTVNEAHAAYQGIVAGSRRAALSGNDFRDVLRLLERRAVVRLGDYDADAQDMDLDIRALITSVAGDDFVASLEQIVSRSAVAGPTFDDVTATGEEG